MTKAASIDPQEVAKFAALADDWWNPEGQFRPLHRLNPTRLAFIRDRAAGHFEREAEEPGPLKGLSLLDIGCGGGLLCEPLARLGADVTGIDVTEENIAAARSHAEAAEVPVVYEAIPAEDLAQSGAQFNIVVSMEVVEHVADLGGFLNASAQLVKPGGIFLTATLNRTPKSFLMAIVGAEYVLRWLPRGTHDWRRFVRPSELVRHLRAGGLTAKEVTGVVYNPLADSWRLSADSDVNYMVSAIKDG
ncbi:MAG: bifunctional 2-polyprenyl-6-hydroxyphenol methylase/3-demethylubiquinol 3-O-methyltransferase UbiG [Pseudomonadota bacterium]